MLTTKPLLRLLPPQALLKTGEVDHADWNFRPLLGWIMRTRYHLARSLLAEHRFGRLLEIGYGSGVFMPELAAYCDDLYGTDVHHRHDEVAARLAEAGVRARLAVAGMEAMPFEDAFFDGLIAVSTVEFVGDLEAGCREARRILRPGGVFIVITPGVNPLADIGLKLLTGKSARQDFADRRQRVLPALGRHFVVERRLTLPRFGTGLVHLYTALKLRA
jgi:ubiquinone/menaquinone biosynthesis C-methylase UbiE